MGPAPWNACRLNERSRSRSRPSPRSGNRPGYHHGFPRSGSIAVIERLILTMKDQCTRLMLVPFSRDNFRKGVQFFAGWYNANRPHTTLGGKTPAEVYDHLAGTKRAYHFEPRPRWPARSRCASPRAPVHGKLGVRLNLHVTYLASRKHLPVVKLRVAA